MIADLICELINIARNGIIQHYSSATNLFDFIVTDNTIKNEKPVLLFTHSLISLLGISNYKDSIGIDYRKSMDKIYKLIISNVSGIREYSLLLWLLAKENDPRSEKVFKYINDKLPDRVISQSGTMELAWMLAGLSFEFRRNNDHRVQTKLISTAKLLNERFIKKNGLFLHRDKKSARWDVRYNIGNFADQIYSIYAISLFTQATKDDEFLETAKKCSNKICSLQGEMGQWWWHYNAFTGKVVGKFPVFSVHQDSMAPFALMALGKLSETNYMSNIQCGLDWIRGNNELSVSMINEDKSFIKRGIKRKGIFSKIQNVATIVSKFSMANCISAKYDQPKFLEAMNWEHSYHLGWILYAFNEKNKHMWSRFQ